jgi:hypothetical protein
VWYLATIQAPALNPLKSELKCKISLCHSPSTWNETESYEELQVSASILPGWNSVLDQFRAGFRLGQAKALSLTDLL